MLACGQGSGDVQRGAFWDNPELFALLAASTPQLRSLEYWFPRYTEGEPASAIPAQIGRLSQLTCLRLSQATITAAQVMSHYIW